MVIWPSFNSSLPTETLGAEEDEFDEGVDGVDEFPIDEKFHLPLGSRSMITCGFSMVMAVTFTCCEKISGIISTPTRRLLAVRKGLVPNFGSSAIDRSSTPSEPVSSERLRLPSLT